MRIWAECTRMTREEMEDTIKEARELSKTFAMIAGLMEYILRAGGYPCPQCSSRAEQILGGVSTMLPGVHRQDRV